MQKARIAIVGFGNVGRAAVAAVEESPDMEGAGIILRNPAKVPGTQKEVGDMQGKII